MNDLEFLGYLLLACGASVIIGEWVANYFVGRG